MDIQWKTLPKYSIGDEVYTSWLDVAYAVSQKGKFRLKSQLPLLSYWENGVLKKEEMKKFIGDLKRDNGEYWLTEDISLGEDPRPLITPENLEENPKNVALLITASGANFYRFSNNSTVFYLDPWFSSYVPFESHESFKLGINAEEKASEMLKHAMSIWAWKHSYEPKFNGESLSLGEKQLTPTYQVSDKKDKKLLRLFIQLGKVNGNDKAVESINKGIEKIKAIRPEEFGYLPVIKIY